MLIIDIFNFPILILLKFGNTYSFILGFNRLWLSTKWYCTNRCRCCFGCLSRCRTYCIYGGQKKKPPRGLSKCLNEWKLRMWFFPKTFESYIIRCMVNQQLWANLYMSWITNFFINCLNMYIFKLGIVNIKWD